METPDNKEEIKEKNKENNNNQKLKKEGFFKKLWNSIVKIEKYPEMATEGLGKAMVYVSTLVAIVAIVLCLGTIYQTHKMVKTGVEYLQKEFPNFSYKEGILNVESEEPITIKEEQSMVGKIVIDSKVEDENQINKYINELNENGEGLVVLKDKVIVKNQMVNGNIIYNYKESMEPLGVKEFTKQDLVNYTNSTKIIPLYISLFMTLFIYAFIMYLLTTLSNVLILSAFGYISTLLSRIKIRYVAIFNMSIYAITLSTILNIIYVGINIFVPFSMKYFQVMYMSVAAIYLIAAILILKTEFIKKQMELIKLAEVQKAVKEEQETQEKKEQEEQNEKEKEERREKDNKENKKENNNSEGEPEGSKA